ncbi:hypothetical protein COJ41_17700 [Bacillus thuringiensis]|uniref:hypothetical protein n=1 Tax=Bacillus thuringiensis TaxID=1428 RepID=UPI000BF4D7ED|nr:hypothetical protein [Bacillus thuringiensis]PFM20870.1 hypothetical protein COJ41_17700 [Bacillus thuringiensis]
MENPASKLYILLKEAYDDCKSTRAIDTSFSETWSKVFKIDMNDRSALLTSMNSMLNLFLTTQDYIKANEKLNNERNLNFLSKIELALSSMNFDGDMSTFKSNINSETLTALSFICDHMNFIYDLHENEINREEITNLIDDIDILITNITGSILEEDVKILLLKNLNAIRFSLASYKISGSEGMRIALEQTIGSLFLNNEVIIPIADDENIKNIFNIIDKINTLLSVGSTAKDLFAPLFNLLIK